MQVRHHLTLLPRALVCLTGKRAGVAPMFEVDDGGAANLREATLALVQQYESGSRLRGNRSTVEFPETYGCKC